MSGGDGPDTQAGWVAEKMPGGDAEAAYREAIAAGDNDARFNLGNLLSEQPGREGEAEAAYREAIDSSATGQVVEAAAAKLGELLARQGDVAGAHAAFEVAARAAARRMGCDLADSTIAKLARFRTAVARRPWALRLNRSIGAVICRLGPVLRSRWQRTRRRPN